MNDFLLKLIISDLLVFVGLEEESWHVTWVWNIFIQKL